MNERITVVKQPKNLKKIVTFEKKYTYSISHGQLEKSVLCSIGSIGILLLSINCLQKKSKKWCYSF